MTVGGAVADGQHSVVQPALHARTPPLGVDALLVRLELASSSVDADGDGPDGGHGVLQGDLAARLDVYQTHVLTADVLRVVAAVLVLSV